MSTKIAIYPYCVGLTVNIEVSTHIIGPSSEHSILFEGIILREFGSSTILLVSSWHSRTAHTYIWMASNAACVVRIAPAGINKAFPSFLKSASTRVIIGNLWWPYIGVLVLLSGR